MSKLDNLKPFKAGQSGNPSGRPQGSRVKLSEAFLSALCADFAQHGAEAIERVRINKPDAYLKIVASILPKQIEVTESPFDSMSDDEIDMIVATATAAIRAHQQADEAEERKH